MTLDSRRMSDEELARALAGERSQLSASTPQSAEWLIHELSVHQIELEMQNRELRRSQIALEESRSKYADLYDLAPIGYCTLDSEGRVLEANLRAAELFGLTRQELVGSSLTPRVALEDRAPLRAHLRACLNNEPCPPCEITLQTRGNGTRCVELVSTALIEPDGRVAACKTTLHDITLAKDVERRLALLAQASELLASSLDVTMTFGAVMRLVVPQLADRATVDVVRGGEMRSFANGAGERRAAYAPSSPQADVLASGDPIYGEKLLCLPLRARGLALGVLTLERDGAAPQSFSGQDLKMAQSLASRLAIAVDNAQLYGDARAAARAREDMLAMVSHDLKNPLQAIRLNAEFIERVADPHVARSVESIQRAVAGMQHLIEDLLDLARIEAGRVVLNKIEFGLTDVVVELIDLIRPLAQQDGIELHATLPPESVRVRGDRGRIVQVLSNLLGNAIKFTPRGGSISFDAAFAEGKARFVVRDTGAGISRDELPHVFERYWQGQRGHGSGLGLYIAKGIVEAHGGQIEAASELDAGTTITFWIPDASRSSEQRRGDRHAAILIVEDDAEIRDVTARIIESVGFAAVTAANGREALAELRENDRRYGLMLVDLQMPVMNGWDLCAALKRDPRLATIPIVVLSAAPDLEEEASALGAAGCLQKPVDVQNLLDAIEAHCCAEALPHG